MDIINSISPHQWYLLGGLLASIPGTIGIVAWIKKHHIKVKGEELWSGFVVLNVTVWSFILTAVDAVSANVSQVTHIGSLIPQVAPYVAVWGPRVSIAALTVHTVASALYKWWQDRKAKKPIVNVNKPDLAAAVQTLNSPTVSGQPSSSMGSASVGMDIQAPPADIFNS